MRFFKETQRFDQWWFHLINLIVLGVMVYPIYQASIFEKIDSREKHILTITFFLVLAILILVYSIRLKSKIDEKGIHFRFFPFQKNYKTISWTDVDKCYVRTYNPIMEYGGWGYRGIGRNSKAFNIKGNQGVQIVVKTGEKILIGTQKPNEVKQTINRYFGKHERI